jgi:hypothetical protein
MSISFPPTTTILLAPVPQRVCRQADGRMISNQSDDRLAYFARVWVKRVSNQRSGYRHGMGMGMGLGMGMGTVCSISRR